LLKNFDLEALAVCNVTAKVGITSAFGEELIGRRLGSPVNRATHSIAAGLAASSLLDSVPDA
jgi:hypothetical protein